MILKLKFGCLNNQRYGLHITATKKSKKNFTNPIFYMKSEKPESEFEVNHVKARGYAEDPMRPGEID